MKNIALVELNNWHGECLYSQFAYLEAGGYQVTLVCDHAMKPRIDFAPPEQILSYDFSRFGDLLSARKAIIDRQTDTMVLNTAQGSRASKLMALPWPESMRLYGVIHNLAKLGRSLGQRIISRRLNGYFCLADYLLHDRTLPPIRFQPFFAGVLKPFESLPIDPAHRLISIPGGVENKRRDYDFLVRLAQHPELSSEIKFVILGNAAKADGPALLERIDTLGLRHRFTLFSEFVDDALFYSYLQQSEYILALTHSEEYRTDKVSGAFLAAKALGRPLLLDHRLSHLQAEYPACFYQHVDACVDLLNQAAGSASDASGLPVAKFDFKTEQKRYLQMFTAQAD